MAANVIADLNDGFKISVAGGKYSVTIVYFGTDLEGATPVERLASILTLTSAELTHTGDDVPAINDTITVNGRTLYATGFEVTPWPPYDGAVVVTYTQAKTPTPGGGDGFSEVSISGGTTAEQRETEFDAANLALAYASRTPISVVYDPDSAGAPVATDRSQTATVPMYVASSTINYTRTEDTEPSTRSRTYSSKTNSATWKGLAIGTVLCTAVTFSSSDGGETYEVTYSFAYNPDGWAQVAIYIDPEQGKPPQLTNAQLAAENGIKQVTVQGEVDFSGLDL